MKMKNDALIKSFEEVYKRIKQRQSVWLDGPTGSFHNNNPEIVKIKLSMIADTIWAIRSKQ